MAADWHVTRQSARPTVDEGGRLVDVVDVFFTIDTQPAQGHTDKVTLTDSQYSADNAAALINDKVARIKAVAGL